MLSRIVFLATSLTLSGCFQALTTTQGNKLKVKSSTKGLLTVTDLGEEKSSAIIDSNSQQTLTVAASTTGSLGGAAVSVSPQTFKVSTSLLIEAGVPFSETSVATEVGLTEDVRIEQASAGVIVRPAEQTELNNPLTISLPIPTSLALNLSSVTYAVYYKFLDPATGQLQTGIKPVDEQAVVIKFNDEAQKDVIQFQGYFGSYWVVVLSRPLAAAEIPAPKVSTEPIVNKAQTVVIGTERIVSEKKVVETQVMPVITLLKPAIAYQAAGRSVSLSLPGTPRVASCTADIFEKTSDASGLSLKVVSDYKVDHKITKVASHPLVGRFRCLDENGRSLVSPWSDSLTVPDYSFAAIRGFDSSLANGFYSTGSEILVQVEFSENVIVKGSPTLILAMASSTREASYKSGSGSKILTFGYSVQAADEAFDLDISGQSPISLPSGASIVDSAGNNVNTSIVALANGLRLSAKKDIEIDAVTPTPPSSIGFGAAFSSSTTLNVSFSAGLDRNLKGHNLKVCTSNDCSSGCSASSLVTSSSFTTTVTNGQSYYACAQAEDNIGLKSAWVPSINPILVDNTPPTVLRVSSTLADGFYKAGQLVPVTVKMSQPVEVIDGASIALQLETGTTDRLAPYSSGSGTDELTFLYTVQAGDVSTDLNYVSTTSLNIGGSIRGLVSGLDLINALPALAGSQSLSTLKAIVIDTLAPSAPAIVSPTSGSILVSPLATVTGTSEAFASVTVLNGATPIGTVAANGSGNYTLSLANVLGDGTHWLSATQTDRAGNLGVASTAFQVTVDTTAPNAPVFNSITSPNSSSSQTFSGSSEPLSIIKIYIDGNLASTVNADGSGNWTSTMTGLGEGTFGISARAMDSSSRESPNSTLHSLVIDQSPPTAPSAIAFSSPNSTSTTVNLSWTNSVDSNFDRHNVKLCTMNDCSTGCLSESVANSSPTSYLAVNNQTFYACVQGVDTLGQMSAWVASAGTVAISDTSVTVIDVSATTADGHYKVGDQIAFSVVFSEGITVANHGQIYIELNINGTARSVPVSSVSTSGLEFVYTVQAGDASADLNYMAIDSLKLGAGGTIVRTAGGAPANISLPPTGSGNSLGGQSAIVIDTTAPTNPTSVGFGSAYSSTTNINVSWASSVDSNFNTYQARLCAANDCSTGCLTPTPTASTVTNLTGVNGSTYYACVRAEDYAGNFSAWAPSAASVIVDTTSPTVTMVTSSAANGTYGVGQSIPITLNFSEAVFVLNGSMINLTLETGTTDAIVYYVSGSGTSQLLFNYTVANQHVSTDLDYQSVSALSLGGSGSIKDVAGNSAILMLPTLGGASSLSGTKTLVIDGVIPSVMSVSSSDPDGSYIAGETIDITVTFTSNVIVTGGSPRINLNTSPMQYATYWGGSGSSVLTFRYHVQAGDTSPDLNYSATSALTLQGATIKSQSSDNDASLILPAIASPTSLGEQKAIEILGNNVAPILSASPNLQNATTGTSISVVNVNSSGSSDLDGDGDPITYSCSYDTTPNSVLDAGGTPCSSLPQDAYGFNVTTGVLSWTPSAAAGNLTTPTVYEFHVTGTDPHGQTGQTSFRVNVLRALDFSIPYDAGTDANYVISSADKIQLSGGLAKLTSMDHTDDDVSVGGFNTAGNGASFIGGENRLRLATAGGCNGLSTNCFAKNYLDWMPQKANIRKHYSFDSTNGDLTSYNSFTLPTFNTTLKKVGSASGQFANNVSARITNRPQGDVVMNFWIFTTQTLSSGGCDTWDDGVGLVHSGPASFSYADYGVSLCGGKVIAGAVGASTTSLTDVNDGKWHMVTAIRKQSTGFMYLYVDGKLQNTVYVGTGLLNLKTTLDIGSSNGTTFFQGQMDELTIWDLALNDDEIYQLYQRQSPKYSGDYVSRVMNAWSPSSWSGLQWSTNKPYGKELPDFDGGAQNDSSTAYPELSNPDISNSLVGLWHFNENVAGTAPAARDFVDNSGAANHGLSCGGLPTLGKPGRFGRAVELADNSCINLGNTPSFDFNTQGVSASLWFKPLSLLGGKFLTTGNVTGTRVNGIEVGMDPYGKIYFAVGCGGSVAANCPVVETTGTYNDGQWHHIIPMLDLSADVMKIYVDGVLALISPRSGSTCATNNLSTEVSVAGCTLMNATHSGTAYVGSATGSQTFHGAVDELAIWKRNMSNGEAQDLYRRGANRVSYQVRTCTAADCNDGVWRGPDGTYLTYFSEIHNNNDPLQFQGRVKPQGAVLPFSSFPAMPSTSTQYFQYRVILESDNVNAMCTYDSSQPCSPEIRSVAVLPQPRYWTSGPTITFNTPIQFYSLNNIQEIATCSSGVKYALSLNGSAYYYWNGSSWAASNNTITQAATAAAMNPNLASFGTLVGRGNLYVKAYLPSSGGSECNLDRLTITGNANY